MRGHFACQLYDTHPNERGDTPIPVEGYNLSAKMRTGFIQIPIELGRIVSATAGESWASSVAAGYVSSASTPRLNALSTAARAGQLQWSSGSVAQLQCPAIMLPPDFTSVSSATFNIFAGRAAAASSDTAPAWSVSFYTSTGSSVAALSIPVTNITSSVPTQYSGSISTTQIGVGYPNFVTVTINPASSQDTPILYGAWIEYQRAPRG